MSSFSAPSNDRPRIVALLPMKLNSVRVTGKNFREFCGKPLFRWILDSLLEINEISQVIINTDARDLLRDNGLVNGPKVLIRDRRPEICGDLVSMNSVIADDIANVKADIYVMTHTTNPLLSPATISEAISQFIKSSSSSNIDSLFSVNKLQTRFYTAMCTPINHDPSNLIPTQDLEPWFEENSNLYIFTSQSFMASKARIGIKPMLFESPRLESIDIDTLEDWKLAEVIANSHLVK